MNSIQKKNDVSIEMKKKSSDGQRLAINWNTGWIQNCEMATLVLLEHLTAKIKKNIKRDNIEGWAIQKAVIVSKIGVSTQLRITTGKGSGQNCHDECNGVKPQTIRDTCAAHS